MLDFEINFIDFDFERLSENNLIYISNAFHLSQHDSIEIWIPSVGCYLLGNGYFQANKRLFVYLKKHDKILHKLKFICRSIGQSHLSCAWCIRCL